MPEEIKFCKDCRWFRRDGQWELSQCHSPSTFQASSLHFLLSGKRNTSYAEIERKYNCGPSGQFWQAKPGRPRWQLLVALLAVVLPLPFVGNMAVVANLTGHLAVSLAWCLVIFFQAWGGFYLGGRLSRKATP